ncbi:MAG TPA: hypothetical protein VMF58_00325 [Rhizomicrobium sp.]|nr:hypothetical protein [Rhizomicrobium sp.]
MNKGLNDPARAYANKPVAADEGLSASIRFAPAENLYDAIRLDVGADGIDNFEPLQRHYDNEPPFSEIDEDWFDDEAYKPE